jgi:predicted TIM-barrel fold metal-dependent hydrolase
MVNLSGGWGAELRANLAALDRAYPGRFATFCNVDWAGVGAPGWTDAAVTQLTADVEAGARGRTVFKELGLRSRDVAGALVMPADPRLTPLWRQAGELLSCVLIHTADPAAFFRPLDGENERWDELHAHPDWHFYGPEFPTFDELLAALSRLIGAHPATTFITAHVGCYPENLGFVSDMMACHPNFCTDFSARIAELGRAPYSAREWMLRYADRILFGTDMTPDPAAYRVHFRFLETADEYFPYNADGGLPPQGRWRIYGLHLPDDVLQKIYHDNAARLLGLD